MFSTRYFGSQTGDTAGGTFYFGNGGSAIGYGSPSGKFLTSLGGGAVYSTRLNGKYVRYSSNKFAIQYSDDGINWNETFTASTGTVYGLAYGAGLYVATFSDGQIYSSPDLVTWTLRTTGSSITNTRISFANNTFMVAGSSNYWRSIDGITWTQYAVPTGASTVPVIVRVNSLWFCLDQTTATTSIYTSADGITWTARTVPSGIYTGALHNGSIYVIHGYSGSAAAVASSTDGITWTARTSNSANRLEGGAVGGSRFVVPNTITTATPNLTTSTDGITWTATSLSGIGTNTVRDVVYGAGVFVAFTSGGYLASSTDGTNWTIRVTPESGDVAPQSTIQFVGGVFVAATYRYFFTSTDGITWKKSIRLPGSTNCPQAATAEAVYYRNGSTLNRSTDRYTFSQTSITADPDCKTVGTCVLSGRTVTKEIHATNILTNTTTTTYTSGIGVGAVGTKNIVLLANHALTTTDNVNWTCSAKLTSTPFFRGKTVNDKFIAFCQLSNYTIATFITSDGTSFSQGSISYPAGSAIYDVAYGNGVYVAIGTYGTVASSTDGITWTNRTSNTGNDINKVIYANGLFVTCGSGGHIVTSPDGITWTLRTSGTTNTLRDIIYANSRFVAVGSSGTIVTSSDGITWTARTSGTTNSIESITYGNSLFVAVDYSGGIRTSPDAITWTARTSGTTSLTAITYANSLFVAVGNSGIYTSADGITWTSRSSVATLSSVISFTNGRFMYPSNGAMCISADGITWSIIPHNVGTTAKGFAYGPSGYSLVGLSGSLFSSTDGIDWRLVPKVWSLPAPDFYASTYGAGQYVAVGAGGVIYTSTDLVTWTARTSGTVYGLKDIAFGKGLFVAVGDSGTIVTSPDGITWTSRTSGTANGFVEIAFGGGMFAAVGPTNSPFISTDGITWTQAPVKFTGLPTQVEFDPYRSGF